MTGRVVHIYRHPIKSHGREALETVDLTAGRTMPWDRTWAVAIENSRLDGTEWGKCANFTRVSKAASLMAISAKLDEQTELVTLSHPDLNDVTLHPERDAQVLIDWSSQLLSADRAPSVRVIRVPGRGMTDSEFPSITLCNLASHREVETRIGKPLSIHRWRGNIWLDGIAPWQEFEWVGHEVQIGNVVFKVRERTDRCMATTANPETGVRDADTLGALRNGWGHLDFSVRAEVSIGGTISVGDTL